MFCTTHLAGWSYNTAVIALHSPVGHDLCLCTECLLARLAGGEPVVQRPSLTIIRLPFLRPARDHLLMSIIVLIRIDLV